jgi:hypothetical protein
MEVNVIEIDDAGGGCFLGPEVLVIHRLETDEIWYLLIPPNVMERILYATKILKKAFGDLAIPKDEKVKLCRGEIFDLFEEYLTTHDYRVVREKVSAATDSLAEAKFMEILYSYGFPAGIRLQNRNYQELYALVSYWYYSEPRYQSKRIRKVRLRPPARPRKIAQKFPNLIRMLLEPAAGNL